VTQRLFAAVRRAAQEGAAVLLVEQQVGRVLQFADRAYVTRRGKVVLEGDAAEVQARRSDIETSSFIRHRPMSTGWRRWVTGRP
jgi:branched-chain amino acid transport system ATP-binding protein